MTELRRRVDYALAGRRLDQYRPYPKQIDFHAAGATKRERLLRAGNQLGKTLCGCAEAAIHLTGQYPDWWTGRRWTRPVRMWAGCTTGELTRDGVQRLMVGEPKDEDAWGTGMLPRAALVDWNRASSVPNALDHVVVAHASGGRSTCGFKSYNQGRQKWQSETLDIVMYDEEPEEEIYTEGLTRTNATEGMVYLLFTPLLGMSSVVRRFMTEQSKDRSDTNMTIFDVKHVSAEQRERIIASYQPHERDARTNGTPTLGEGRIYPVAEDVISVPAFQVPSHWVQIAALDFGWSHPTAAVKIAWDRDTDCVYVTHVHRLSEATPIVHAATLRAWGDWLPWAWPHDGLQHDKGSGEQLAELYRDQGLRMLPERAKFEGDRGSGVEAGLIDILDRMQSGRFKVFAHLAAWFEEFRLYHRKDGRVSKEFDDLMDATRYAIMSLRFARLNEKKTLNLKKPHEALALAGGGGGTRGGSWMGG
jgi:phage terminase large subunit-like protein